MLRRLRDRRRGNALHLEEPLIAPDAPAHRVALHLLHAGRQLDSPTVLLGCRLVVDAIGRDASADSVADVVAACLLLGKLIVRLGCCKAAKPTGGVAHLRGGVVALPGEGSYLVLGHVQLVVVGLVAGHILAGSHAGRVGNLGRLGRAGETRIVGIHAHGRQAAFRRGALLRVGARHVGGSHAGLLLDVAGVQHLVRFGDVGIDRAGQVGFRLLPQQPGGVGLLLVERVEVGVILRAATAAALVESARAVRRVAVKFGMDQLEVSRIAT